MFVLPLRSGGYARGVVARSGRRGKVLLGYFFGPKIELDQASVEGIRPEDAVLRVRFGDFDLFRGNWKVIGQVSPWSRADWPIPQFLWQDLLRRSPDKIIIYTDDDFDKGGIGREESPETIPPDLRRDGMLGSGVVEIELTELST